MAVGWAKDGAVQEQIDAGIDDAVTRARSQMPKGDSLAECDNCGKDIPAARQKALPGVRLCIDCQAELEKVQGGGPARINRRGSKDSQLK
jgi:phage/conjugal plasmid C-4 type zinc finger TraR family protein